jgi:hypothetical protein
MHHRAWEEEGGLDVLNMRQEKTFPLPVLSKGGNCVTVADAVLYWTCSCTSTRLQVAAHLMGQEIEVLMIEMKPYETMKASETKAKTQRLSVPGTIVQGVVRKVRGSWGAVPRSG